MDMNSESTVAADCPCRQKTDRYLSFEGIDCAGNARRIMEYIVRNQASAGPGEAFWAYFMAKRQPTHGLAPDDLFLVHSYINQIRELFENCGDTEALALLMQVEEECC